MVEKKRSFSEKERAQIEKEYMKSSNREFTNALILDYFDVLTKFPEFDTRVKSVISHFLPPDQSKQADIQTSHLIGDEHFTFRYKLRDRTHRYLEINKVIKLTDEYYLKNEQLILSTLHDEKNTNDPGYTIKYQNIPQSRDEIFVEAENTQFAVASAQELLYRIEAMTDNL